MGKNTYVSRENETFTSGNNSADPPKVWKRFLQTHATAENKSNPENPTLDLPTKYQQSQWKLSERNFLWKEKIRNFLDPQGSLERTFFA